MPTIILNATNLSNYGSGNNRLVYSFQGGGVTFKDNDIALAQASLYFSWFNVNQSVYRNATFSYRWVDGTINLITIPNGHYSVASLNAFVQEHISGMQVVQVFAAEEKEMQKLAAQHPAIADLVTAVDKAQEQLRMTAALVKI